MRDAVAGVDVIVHAATNSPAAQRGRFALRDFFGSPSDVDVDGTSALLDAAGAAGVAHFVHVSIVGLEHLRRLPYSSRKPEAERLVRDSSVPSTILRATACYWLLERMFSNMLWSARASPPNRHCGATPTLRSPTRSRRRGAVGRVTPAATASLRARLPLQSARGDSCRVAG